MDSAPSALLEELRRLQIDMARAGWPERRAALRRSIEHELERIPRDARIGLLARLRAEVRQTDESAVSASSAREINALRAELNQATQEREGLQNEVARLEQENQQLRTRPTESAPAGDSTGFREGLLLLAKGKAADPDKLGMSATDADAFRAVTAMFSFVLEHEVIAKYMLRALASDIDAMGTDALSGMRREFCKCFRQALENSEEGRKALKEQLDQTLQMVSMLGNAIVKVAGRGTSKLLADLNPDDALQKHTRAVLGPDYNATYRTMLRNHGDAARYKEGGFWEVYFQPAFKEEMRKYL